MFITKNGNSQDSNNDDLMLVKYYNPFFLSINFTFHLTSFCTQKVGAFPKKVIKINIEGKPNLFCDNLRWSAKFILRWLLDWSAKFILRRSDWSACYFAKMVGKFVSTGVETNLPTLHLYFLF